MWQWHAALTPVPVPVPVPVADLVGVSRRLRWGVEMEQDCPRESMVEGSYWTVRKVVDLEVDQRIIG